MICLGESCLFTCLFIIHSSLNNLSLEMSLSSVLLKSVDWKSMKTITTKSWACLLVS